MTKTELKKTLKQILKTTPVFQNLHPLQISLFPRLENQSIRQIGVIQKGKRKLFRIVFQNGSFLDCGVNKLLRKQDEGVKIKFQRDCREAIQPQIKKYYQNMIASGKVKPTNKKLHVDHVYPFSYLINDFCLESKLSFFTLESDSLQYQQAVKDFAVFHSKKAKLQLLTETANLQKSNKLV